MRHSAKMAFAVAGMILLCGAGGDGCTTSNDGNQARVEQADAANAQGQIVHNQPAPKFDYSLERHMLIEIYKARQRATNTFSVVQSNYTGKVLWSCPSMGFPLPYATQLTNPHQGIVIYDSHDHDGSGVVEQAEPNGLYSPAQADATWVPCLSPDGRITPVYEENHVSVFFQPMQEIDGKLTPVPGTKPSFSISTQPE